jgi:hypothetical protein
VGLENGLFGLRVGLGVGGLVGLRVGDLIVGRGVADNTGAGEGARGDGVDNTGAGVGATGDGVDNTGAGVGATGDGGDNTGAGVGMKGAGVGKTGAGVEMTGAGVGKTGAGVGVTGAGVGNTGAGVEMTGAGVGAEVNETNFVDTFALAGTVPVLIEFTVIFKLLLLLVKLGIIMIPPVLSFACRFDVAYPVPVARVVTRT